MANWLLTRVTKSAVLYRSLRSELGTHHPGAGEDDRVTTRLGATLLARAILATKTVDRAYRLFDRARSRAVVRWASDAVLDEFNAVAYARDDTYRPETAAFRSKLFPWEAAAVRDHFDPPPGRILLGGAGGGREAFALAEQGYEVIAFEPATELAEAMAVRAVAIPLVRSYRAHYEDLPLLEPARLGDTGADVRDLAPFTAAVMGWGSFSHLASHAARVRALASLGEVTAGPILVSFLAFSSRPTGLFGAQHDRRGDVFSIFIGYYHSVTDRELEELAAAANLDVTALNTDETESTWPHAVLRSNLVPRLHDRHSPRRAATP